MKIEIFGPGCHRCHDVEKCVSKAVSESGVEAEIEKVKDMGKIVDAGIMQTPGLKINGKIKCSGRVPNIEEVKKWITEEK